MLWQILTIWGLLTVLICGAVFLIGQRGSRPRRQAPRRRQSDSWPAVLLAWREQQGRWFDCALFVLCVVLLWYVA
jgi:hypothetical protein